MMKKILIVVLVLVMSCLMTYGCLSQSAPTSGYAKADLVNGALLYDNWPKVTGHKTEGSHPLYPGTGKKQGGSSWRCKECHGWDYVGKNGRYAKGSHFTGIAGTLQSAKISSNILYSALTTGQHNFGQYLDETDIWSLVKFIREGQVAYDRGGGEATNGSKLFAENCSVCHGANGNAFDFNEKNPGVQGVGWLANDNPEESLHKFRWGHPGTDMPSMVADVGLSEKQILDLLAYAQTL